MTTTVVSHIQDWAQPESFSVDPASSVEGDCMRVGILDVLAQPARRLRSLGYGVTLVKQYASVTPQAVACWCRQLGHETFYATYYGVGNILRSLPRDLDILFVSSYTQASPLAYAVANSYRSSGTLLVVGGPHAKAFPLDCLRFFDIAVHECDKSLISDILAGHFDRGSVVSSGMPLTELPTVEERMPEIRASSFFWRRWRSFTTCVPLLNSVGCPYTCNFCIDSKNPYKLLSPDQLAIDLRYVTTHFGNTMVAFHDPNFAVRFDRVLEVIETLEKPERPPYVMECSLSILRGDRLKRLQDTNCIAVAPGVESWMDYSNKTGVGRTTGMQKVEMVVKKFAELRQHVPYLQANFIFGLDTDKGDEPVRLTKEFMARCPFVWPVVNIPVPYGGTPLFDDYLANERILTSMPFAFYYAPFLVTTLKHYDPVTYYERLIELSSYATSPEMLRRRVGSTSNKLVQRIHWVRTLSLRAQTRTYRRILKNLRRDSQLRSFHEGRSDALPRLYQVEYERALRPYSALLSTTDRVPNLKQADVSLPIVQLGEQSQEAVGQV
jgi:radical SAM superfamily enzyme YgiQ (UPF0313 family)